MVALENKCGQPTDESHRMRRETIHESGTGTMFVIVRCPQCATQLRVGEELIGKKVRCPSCSHIFVAPAEQPAPAANSTPGTGDEGWKNLNLELDGPGTPAPGSSAPASTPAAPPPTETVDPWKTMNLSLDEPEPASPKQREELSLPTRESSLGRDREADDEPRPRARLLDDHEEMRNCPTCGKMIYREATSCFWCGERFNRNGGRRTPRYDEDRDRDRDYDDRPRRRRRDWEPHRGNTIMTLGIISLVVSFMGGCLLWIVGLPLGIIAWWMGAVDLNKMRRSQMDPEGEASTRSGYICAIIGTIINALFMAACVGYIGFIGFIVANEDKMRNQRNNPPGIRR
jgi:predicted Zn finger-like uncharacterized protein